MRIMREKWFHALCHRVDGIMLWTSIPLPEEPEDEAKH